MTPSVSNNVGSMAQALYVNESPICDSTLASYADADDQSHELLSGRIFVGPCSFSGFLPHKTDALVRQASSTTSQKLLCLPAFLLVASLFLASSRGCWQD